MRVINSVGRNIFKAIHEGKWLYIEYKNKSDTKSNEILPSYHYRCNKAIIDFSNKKYYNNKLKIKTVSQSTQPLTFVDIQPENPANPENPNSGKDNNTGNNSGSETNENGGEKIESVSTGDEFAVGFWSLMAVIMVSIVMCMAFTKIRRKKQRN